MPGPTVGRDHLCGIPRARPAPPAHPRSGPIRPAGGREHGSNAPLAGRPAGRRTAEGKPRGPAVPRLTSLSEAGPHYGAPPPLRPGWAGRLGLRERGRGRASACCARAGRSRVPRPPTHPLSRFPSPEARAGSRVSREGGPREGARGGAGRAARVPGRPPRARGRAQRSPGAGSAGPARARAMPR